METMRKFFDNLFGRRKKQRSEQQSALNYPRMQILKKEQQPTQADPDEIFKKDDVIANRYEIQ